MSLSYLTLSFLLSWHLGCSLGAVVERVADLPGSDYDFVIIGGGTAGNVLANRLTEDPRHTVLVLEAGGTNQNVLNSMVPFFWPKMTPNTPFDWNFTTSPQAGLNGRSVIYPRGHVLGGSSSVNSMAYTRGTADDYDRYARLSRDPGWSWDRIQLYLHRNERFTPPVDHHNTAGQFNPAFHSFNGINSVSLPGFKRSIDQRVLQTTKELHEEFPFNLDTNSGNHLGIGWTQSTIGNGQRSSSATSYLGPQFSKRRNLHVLLHAQVARVLNTGSKHGILAFQAVEFTEGVGGPVKRVRAAKEVIISAGAVGSPHILLNSGIGDTHTLSRFGIKPLVHLPSVGQNLSDHPFLGNTWTVNSDDTFETLTRNDTLEGEELKQWMEFRRGPLAEGTFNHAGWLRLPQNSSIFKQSPDPSAGPHTAHIEFVISNGISRLPPPPTGNFFAIGTAVLSPTSRGSVTLSSKDPFAPPIIDPNFLHTQFDIFTMREAVKMARRFVAAPVWRDYIIASTNNATTDDELDQFIRNNTGSIFHPVGTASMSPKGATFGVVDPDLRVKGVAGLRVVDASVVPIVPAAHTQVVTYVFAERASDLIKQAWK